MVASHTHLAWGQGANLQARGRPVTGIQPMASGVQADTLATDPHGPGSLLEVKLGPRCSGAQAQRVVRVRSGEGGSRYINKW